MKKKHKEGKHLVNREKLILKINRTNRNSQIIKDRPRKIALTPKEVVATVHVLQTSIVAAVAVILEQIALRRT